MIQIRLGIDPNRDLIDTCGASSVGNVHPTVITGTVATGTTGADAPALLVA